MAMSLLPVIEMQGTFVVEDRQPDHTHDGNMSKSLARKAVGKMKNDRHSRYIWTIGNTCLGLLTFYCSSFTHLTFFPVLKFLIYVYRFLTVCDFIYFFCDTTRLIVMRLTVFAIICHTVQWF